MGKTESLFNILGHRFTDGPYVPALYIGPTEKNVRSISKDRIDKMLRSTPILWERTERGQRYTTYEKFIAGTPLRFGWAGSATELSSHPCGTVLVDERDRMTNDTGDEGDPVELARARTKNYRAAKVGISSTPTIEDASPVWALLDEGTRHFWAWHCLHCPAVFVPRLDLLKWPEGCNADDALTEAGVVCPDCGHKHVSEDQPTLNEKGRYVRHRKLEDREKATKALWGMYLPDTDARPMRTASFWISGLASPWVTFGQAARSLIQAYKSGESERIQAVVNTWGGELYRVRGEAPEWHEVSGCRIEYVQKSIPEGVQRITLGADVQKNGIFWVTRGWGYNSESWLLDEGFLAGETDHETVWASLRQVITDPIENGRRIDRAFIDSGYRPGDTNRRPDHAVYTFCRSLPGVAFPTKGQDTMDQPFRHSSIDYTYGGVQVKHGIRLYHLNTDYFKRWLHGRIRWPKDQQGGWHLHNAVTEDYCKQIVSEQLLLKASGRAVWIRKSRNNHFLDCEVNATGAAHTLNVHKLPPYVSAAQTRETSPDSEVKVKVSRYARSGL